MSTVLFSEAVPGVLAIESGASLGWRWRGASGRWLRWVPRDLRGSTRGPRSSGKLPWGRMDGMARRLPRGASDAVARVKVARIDRAKAACTGRNQRTRGPSIGPRLPTVVRDGERDRGRGAGGVDRQCRFGRDRRRSTSGERRRSQSAAASRRVVVIGLRWGAVCRARRPGAEGRRRGATSRWRLRPSVRAVLPRGRSEGDAHRCRSASSREAPFVDPAREPPAEAPSVSTPGERRAPRPSAGADAVERGSTGTPRTIASAGWVQATGVAAGVAGAASSYSSTKKSIR